MDELELARMSLGQLREFIRRESRRSNGGSDLPIARQLLTLATNRPIGLTTGAVDRSDLDDEALSVGEMIVENWGES